MRVSLIACCLISLSGVSKAALPNQALQREFENSKFLKTSQVIEVSERWISQREEQMRSLARADEKPGTSHDLVSKKAIFPPHTPFAGEDSLRGMIQDFLIKMEPLVSGSGYFLNATHPLKGLGAIFSVGFSEDFQNCLESKNVYNRSDSLRFALTIFPRDSKDLQKLARSKRFYGLSASLRSFVCAAQEGSARAVFALDRLIRDARTYRYLSRVKMECANNKGARHRESIKVLLQNGVNRVPTNAIENFFFNQSKAGQKDDKACFENALELMNMLWELSSSGSSQSSTTCLSEEDVKKILDSIFDSPQRLEQHFLAWPMWSCYAQKYAGRRTDICVRPLADSFTGVMLRKYGYIKSMSTE